MLNEKIKATRKTPLVLAVEHCDHVGIYADRRIDLRRHTMTRTNSLEAELVAEQLLELDLTKPELDLYLPGVDATGAGFVGIVQHKDIDAEQLEANEWAMQVMRILTEIGSEQ
ncbi:MAG TPA: hypothetical protein EYQ31_05480 [Candidatus Handelsmanbacteria bacterium]|nr:hypothetical protein [Candidatus Handelsmanbacteria bacterium]